MSKSEGNGMRSQEELHESTWAAMAECIELAAKLNAENLRAMLTRAEAPWWRGEAAQTLLCAMTVVGLAFALSKLLG